MALSREDDLKFRRVISKIQQLMVKENIKNEVDSIELPAHFSSFCPTRSFTQPDKLIKKKLIKGNDSDAILLKNNDTIIRTLSLTKLLEDIR